MSRTEDNEHNTDWLDALQSDARQFELVINRVEALGLLCCEHIKNHDLKAALGKLAEMGEGIRLCKNVLGLK